MFTVSLAIRNLLRNPRRAVLSVVAIIAGIVVLLLGEGFVGGMKENIVRTHIDGSTGHVALRPEGYPTEPLSHPVDDLIALTPEAEAWLDDNTFAWTRRMLFTPELIAGSDGMRVRGIGFDPESDEAVFPRTNWSYDGTWPTSAKDGVALAPTPAKLLGVKTGDWVTISVRSHPGALNAIRVPVAVVFHSGSPYLDHASVFVPWELSKQLLLHGEKFSHANIRLASRNNVDEVGQTVMEKLEGAEYLTWDSASAELVATQNIRQAMLQFITAILLLVSALSIANTILMAAYERIREIGTLRAMGMTRTGVIGLFVAEGSIMGFVGGLVGTIVGGALVYHWSTQGIDLAPMIEEVGTQTYANLPFTAIIYMNFSPTMLGVALLFSLLVSVTASVYPAIVASNMLPADAVRG